MNEVIELLENLMKQAAAMADEFSEEEMAQILKVFEKAVLLIQERSVTTEPTGVVPIPPEPSNLQPTDHPSSNINAFQYDPKTGQLMVKFMGKDVADAGPTYSYDGVPPYIFDILKRGAVAPKTSGKNKWHRWKKGVTPSHGASMAALVKAGNFPYKKVA